jgi:hypothetical protein
MMKAHTGPGRPPKYGRAARAVTVTLPVDVLARLSVVHADIGRAIVALTEQRVNGQPRPRCAELAEYGSRAVILVNPVKALKRLPGVQLVPLNNGRALISLDPHYSIPQLELDLRDAMDQPSLTATERELLREIGRILHGARRSRRVKATPRTIIVLERKRPRTAALRSS